MIEIPTPESVGIPYKRDYRGRYRSEYDPRLLKFCCTCDPVPPMEYGKNHLIAECRQCGKYPKYIIRICCICRVQYINVFEHPNKCDYRGTCWECVNKYTFPCPSNANPEWAHWRNTGNIVPPPSDVVIRAMTEAELDEAMDDMFSTFDTREIDFGL